MTVQSRRNFLKKALVGAAALPVLATAARADGHATTHQVSIEGFAFVPANLTINAGDTVVFTNADSAPHTATDANGAFDTGRLNRGASAQLTFNSAGSFNYICSLHPNMRGTITIN